MEDLDAATAAAFTSTTSPAAMDDPGTLVVETKDCDIILGRGKNANNRPGNVEFRKLVLALSPEYEASTGEGRVALAHHLILQIRQSGARFLESVTAANSKGHMVAAWEVVSGAKALAKVKQALRDVAPARKNKSKRRAKAKAAQVAAASPELVAGAAQTNLAAGSLSRRGEATPSQDRQLASRHRLSGSNLLVPEERGVRVTQRPALRSSELILQLPPMHQQVPRLDPQLAQQLRLVNMVQQQRQSSMMSPYSQQQYLPHPLVLSSHVPIQADTDMARIQQNPGWILQQLRQREATMEQNRLRELLLQQQQQLLSGGMGNNIRSVDNFLSAQQLQRPLSSQSALPPKRRQQLPLEDEDESSRSKVAKVAGGAAFDAAVLQETLAHFGPRADDADPYASNALAWLDPFQPQAGPLPQPVAFLPTQPVTSKSALQKRDRSSSSSSLDEDQNTTSGGGG